MAGSNKKRVYKEICKALCICIIIWTSKGSLQKKSARIKRVYMILSGVFLLFFFTIFLPAPLLQLTNVKSIKLYFIFLLCIGLGSSWLVT